MRFSSSVSIFAVLVGWLLLLSVGQAHPLLQNSATVEVQPGRLTMQLTSSVREMQVAAGLMPDARAGLPEEVLRQAAERHASYLTSHLHVRLPGGKELRAQIVRVDFPSEILVKLATMGAERTMAEYTFEYALPVEAKDLQLSTDMLREFPYAPGEAWEVTYNTIVKHPNGNGQDLRILGSGRSLVLQPAAAPPGKSATLWASSGAYFHLGVWHILLGWDHLLFVTALTLAAGRLIDLIKVIGAFTLAHTLTLILSVLNVVRLSPSIVEPLIALSIVFVAIENVFRPGAASGIRRLTVAFGFGLFHGLGFAGGLLETLSELSGVHLGTAIASFSAGVEVGHLIVVIPLLLFLQIVQKHWTARSRPLAQRWGSACISLAGCYYLAVTLSNVL